MSQPREIIEALEFGAEHAGFDSDQIIRMWGEERMAEQIATCPNGHGPMKRVVAPLAPGAAAFESWECETCHIEKMWPDPVPTHLPRRPLVTDVTPSAVEWTFTEYGGSQGKAVVVLTKNQALHIKEYLTATSERGQPPVDPIAEIFEPEARCLCGHKRSRHGVYQRSKTATCYECECDAFRSNRND